MDNSAGNNTLHFSSFLGGRAAVSRSDRHCESSDHARLRFPTRPDASFEFTSTFRRYHLPRILRMYIYSSRDLQLQNTIEGPIRCAGSWRQPLPRKERMNGFDPNESDSELAESREVVPDRLGVHA